MGHPARSVRLAVTAATVLYTALLLASGVHLPGIARKAVGFLPTVLGGGVVLFDIWIWRLPGVHRLAGRPRLDGTWLTEIVPRDGSRIPDGTTTGRVETVLVIEQTYWSVAVRQRAAHSRSWSTSAALRPEGDSKTSNVLAYTYRTEPDLDRRDANPPQTGACRLVATGRAPVEITGVYWTDALTAGTVTARLVSRATDTATVEQARALGA